MAAASPLAPFVGDRIPRILIVDDEPVNLQVLGAHLARWGCTVQTAASGAEALDRARGFQPDLVLLDVLMPEQSGFEACRALQDDPMTRRIPVIFLTALVGQDAKVEGLESGARDYVTKPFLVGELAARVGARLREKYAEDALRARRQELPSKTVVDPVTRVLTRESFEEVAGRALAAPSEAGRPASYMVVDVDGLEIVNQERGREVGDRVLRAVALGMLSLARESDLAGRSGDDELVWLLPGSAEREAKPLAQALRSRHEAARPTVSIGGVTVLPDDSDPRPIGLPTLAGHAQEALMRAKQEGGNHVVWLSSLAGVALMPR